MASLADFEDALAKADAAGDTDAAQHFADMIKSMRAASAPVAPKVAPAQAPMGIIDRLGRDVEPWLSVASNAAAMPVAGWAGLLAGGDGDVVNRVQSALSYQPRTKGGQQGLEALGGVVQKAGDVLSTPVQTGALGDVNPISRYAADSGALADAGNPGWATFHAMIPQALAALSSGGASSATENVLRGLPSAAAKLPATFMDSADSASAALRSRMGMVDTPIRPTASQFAPIPAMDPASVPGMAPIPAPLQAAVAKVPNANPAVLQRHAQAASLPVPMRLTKGQATQDVNLFSQEQNNRAGAMADFINSQNGDLVKNMDAIRKQVAPDVTAPDQTSLGQTLVDRYKQLDSQLSDDISAKYQALADANGGQIPIDGQSLTTSILSALDKSKKAAFLPEKVKAYLGNFADGPLSFDDFEDLRTTLAKASRATSDGNEQSAISAVRNAVESLPLTEETEQIKPLADAARQAARNRFQLIENDPAYKAVDKDSAGLNEPSPLAEKFVDSYVAKAPSASVGRMVANLQNVDPATQQEIAAGLMDHLRKQAGIDLRTGTGNVTQAGYNKTLAAPGFGQKIDMLFDPKSAAQVKDLGDVAKYTQFQGRGGYVNNSNTLVGSNVQLAKTAATAALQGMADVPSKWSFGALPPVGTIMRERAEQTAMQKAFEDATRLGTGLDYVPNASRAP